MTVVVWFIPFKPQIRLRENDRLPMAPDGLPESTEVCAKCQVSLPCSVASPLPIGAL